jgi:hypothetical protein
LALWSTRGYLSICEMYLLEDVSCLVCTDWHLALWSTRGYLSICEMYSLEDVSCLVCTDWHLALWSTRGYLSICQMYLLEDVSCLVCTDWHLALWSTRGFLLCDLMLQNKRISPYLWGVLISICLLRYMYCLTLVMISPSSFIYLCTYTVV